MTYCLDKQGLDMIRAFIATAAIAAIFTFTACNDTRLRSTEIRHPTSANIVEDSLLADLVPATETGVTSSNQPLSARAEALTGAVPLYSLGSLNGPVHSVWGRIKDVAVHRNIMYVLDSQYNVVRSFMSNGQFLSSYGQSGPGPGEFQWPESLVFTSSGIMAVAARNEGIELFAREDTFSKFRHVGIARGVVSFDMCAIGERIYVRGFRAGSLNGHLIHELDVARREWVNSFGTPYESDSRLVTMRLSRGLLACVANPPTIITAFRLFPTIHAYSPDGELLWMSNVGDFQTSKIVESVTPDGRTTITVAPRENAHYIQSLTALSEGGVLVQVIVLGEADPSTPARYPGKAFNSYVFSARTGQGRFIPEKLPYIVEAHGDRLYAAGSAGSGYPSLSVYEY